jgi:hypothetical protein
MSVLLTPTTAALGADVRLRAAIAAANAKLYRSIEKTRQSLSADKEDN